MDKERWVAGLTPEEWKVAKATVDRALKSFGKARNFAVMVLASDEGMDLLDKKLREAQEDELSWRS
jgi:hypothetical protein